MAHHLFGRLAQNCLREVRSSLSMRKPLVLVQEAHPAKGGTLEELRAECPEDLQAAVFDADWRRRKLAVWHRVEEFQLVSLKIIAEARPLSGCFGRPSVHLGLFCVRPCSWACPTTLE